jgi:hypothetical protein
LYYLSARHYDPATMQFLTKDPARADGEESAYQHCGGDPVGKVDPSGMWWTLSKMRWKYLRAALYKFMNVTPYTIINKFSEVIGAIGGGILRTMGGQALSSGVSGLAKKLERMLAGTGRPAMANGFANLPSAVDYQDTWLLQASDYAYLRSSANSRGQYKYRGFLRIQCYSGSGRLYRTATARQDRWVYPETTCGGLSRAGAICEGEAPQLRASRRVVVLMGSGQATRRARL